jgi:aminomethyltransferase
VFNPQQLIVDYGDLQAEIASCRNAAALFDFSFISSARISGPDSLNVIAHISRRNFEQMEIGQIRYALGCDADGRLRSDLTIWKEASDKYIVMSGLDKDLVELAASASSSPACEFVNISNAINVYSIQGPNTLNALTSLVDKTKLSEIPYFGFANLEVAGMPCVIGRLGYSGEFGFEIILPTDKRTQLWTELSIVARPCGFAAIDRLRIEAGFVLFANEFRLPVTAADIGLTQFAEKKAQPPRYRLICFCAISDETLTIWSPADDLLPPEQGCITITSACSSPDNGAVLGLGFVQAKDFGINGGFKDPLWQFTNIQEVSRPFYDTLKRRPRATWN